MSAKPKGGKLMLTERQKLILGAIVYQYTQTAHAVGSKKLQEQLNIKVSPATIRNEMAVLEEADLIRKLHTSAGRVPSVAGYRYYLDNLMISRSVSQSDIERLLTSLSGNFHEIDDFLDETAKRLSELTNCTALILKPPYVDLKISSFQLIPLEGRQLIAVLVTNYGKVTSQTFKLPQGLHADSLTNMVAYINAQMVGRPVKEVLTMMNSGELPIQLTREIQSPAAFLQLFGEVLAQSIEEHVHVGGRLNVLELTENRFDDLTKARRLLELLDSPQALRHLARSSGAGISIKVGSEIGEDLLDAYSVLSRHFSIGQQDQGIIILVGPVRMPYAQNALILNIFGQALTQKMLDYV